MFCSSCGAELNDNDVFCSNCGAKVEEDEYSDPQQLEEGNDGQQPEADIHQQEKRSIAQLLEMLKSKMQQNTQTTVMVVALALVVIGIVSFIIARIVNGNGARVQVNLQSSANLAGDEGLRKDSWFSVNIYSAGDEEDVVIQNASISFYAGFDNSEDAPVMVIDGDSIRSKSKAHKLEDGKYTIVVSADGYYGAKANLTVVNGEGVDFFLTPKPEEGTIIYRVDWKGEQDLDICAFNATESEYISAGSASDLLGTHVSSDNSSSKGYELLYLPQTETDDVRTIYVVDTLAAKAGEESAMERDGVTVTAYDSNGELYSIEADVDNTSPIWNVGYVYSGTAYMDTVGYIADSDRDNRWSQYLKEGQTERISDTIASLNSMGDTVIPTINVSADGYVPAEKNVEKKWDMSVFYALEASYDFPGYYDKNLCLLKKLQARSDVTNNIIDYDIYLNPETGVPNKIVSIEYISTGIEVFEYYYDNNGKISFIFHYYADNYVSTYATVGKAGERFLFCDDSLVTWRVVQAGNKVDNYCYGEAERQRLFEGSWNNRSIWEYSTLSDDMRSRFDENERLMISYAYNVYNMAVNTEAVGRIIGVLYKGDYEACSNVDIEVYDKSFDRLLYTAKTDSNGEYCIYVPAENYTYNLRVRGTTEANTYDIYNVKISYSAIVYYVDAGFYFETEDQEQEVTLYIGNAFEGYGSNIDEANIYVRKGINNRTGEILLTSQTDYSGYVHMFLLPGVYTIEACKSGYESIYYTIVASPYYSNQYEYYTPPTLSDGEYAIVLSWGEYPFDLDSHLFTDGGGTSTHVWYHNRQDNFSSYLDVDDTASYGPETITIISYNQNYYYKYCVVDYSNSSSGYYNSTEMSYSNATVNVYSAGGHVSTYHVPFNREGVVWEVFEIRNGVLTPIQRYYNNMDDQQWWME